MVNLFINLHFLKKGKSKLNKLKNEFCLQNSRAKYRRIYAREIIWLKKFMHHLETVKQRQGLAHNKKTEKFYTIYWDSRVKACD